MVRLILAIIGTVALVGFTMANTHDVSLSVIFGAPIRIRMIFLLLTTFLAGVITTALSMMFWRVRTRRRMQAFVPRPPEEVEE